jgi:predicted ATPase
VGKTRLALEVAERHEGRVAFADLTEAAGEDVEITVARATGVPLRPPYIERIATRMMVEPTLLVLDCCEAAVDHVAALGAQLMALCPSMSVLATSRTPVGVPGEGLIEIEPLESADAVEMLRQRVVHAGIPPPPDEVLGDLCARVDCLPLTIEMLAGAMRSLSDDELLDADSDPLSLLGGRDGDLASSVARSVDLLDRAERVTFERLSMFRAPFVLDTASGVIAHPEHPRAVDHLRSLRDRSLVSVVDTRAGRRLRMLDTVRAVARRSLEERDDPQAAKQFVSVFRARGRQIDEGLRTPAEVRWLWVAAAEMADLRSAHRIALESGDTDAAAEIAGSMFHLVYDRLRPDLAQWSEETIDVVGISHPLAPRLLGAAALGAMHVDDYDRAWRWVERARSGAPISPYVELAAANLTLRSGDLESTERAAEQVVATSAASGDDYTVAIGHLLRALAHGYRGDLERGLEIAREQRRVSRRVGAPTLLAYADYLEGELRSETEPVVALELLHRARTRATKCASPLAEGVALVTTTTIRARASDESGADLDFASTMRHWRDRGDWNLQWATVRNFAEYLARTGRYEAAATIIGAIDAHGSPAFGAEAIRLDAARQLMGSRVDTERTALLAARGRSMTGEELLSYALEAADHPIGQDGSLA